MKHATRDNTGYRRYQEGIVFPTLDFPSDHALVSASVKPIYRIQRSAIADCEYASCKQSSSDFKVDIQETMIQNLVKLDSSDSSEASVPQNVAKAKVAGGVSLWEYWGITDTSTAMRGSSRFVSNTPDQDDSNETEEVDEDIDQACRFGQSEFNASVREFAITLALKKWFILQGFRQTRGCTDDNKVSGRSIWIIFRWSTSKHLNIAAI